jgi:general secretion pathway protein I
MMRCRRGFTLLEVLIALAIVAIGLTAALRATGVGLEGTLEHRSHYLALWLAENVAAERTARREWLDPGTRGHEEELAGHRFVVREEITATRSPRFRRLEIRVASVQEPERTLRHLVVFLVRPG